MPNYRVLHAGGCATVSSSYSLQEAHVTRDALTYTADHMWHPQDYVQYASFEHLVPAFESVSSASRTHVNSRSAARLFLLLYGEDLAPPAVTPTPDGGIQFEWFRHGTDVELLFDADGDTVVLVDNDGVVQSEMANGLPRSLPVEHPSPYPP